MSYEPEIRRRRSFLIPKPFFSPGEDADAQCSPQAASKMRLKFRAAALTASLLAKLAKDEKKRQLAREEAVKRMKKEQRLKRRHEGEKRRELWAALREARDAQSKMKEQGEEREARQRQILTRTRTRAPP